MGSRVHPEPGHESHAEDILLAAAERGLGSRRRLRLLAIAVWCAFLGAVVTFAATLAVLPASALESVSFGELSLAFLSSWALAMIPVSLALLLATPDRHGH